MALQQHVVQGCQAKLELELTKTKSRERHLPLIYFPASQIQALSRSHTETLEYNTDQEPPRSKNGVYLCVRYPWFFSWSPDSECYSFYRWQCFMFTHTVLSMGDGLLINHDTWLPEETETVPGNGIFFHLTIATKHWFPTRSILTGTLQSTMLYQVATICPPQLFLTTALSC